LFETCRVVASFEEREVEVEGMVHRTEEDERKDAETEMEGASLSRQQIEGLFTKLAPVAMTLCTRFDGPEDGATPKTSEEEWYV
jgi:hypothetical protein